MMAAFYGLSCITVRLARTLPCSAHVAAEPLLLPFRLVVKVWLLCRNFRFAPDLT